MPHHIVRLIYWYHYSEFNITFSSENCLNITVFDGNRTLILPFKEINGKTISYSFGKINTTFIFKVGFRYLEDIFAEYDITITFVETYIPNTSIPYHPSTGNGKVSKSGLDPYLIELASIFVSAIVIMVIVQIRLKDLFKDILG